MFGWKYLIEVKYSFSRGFEGTVGVVLLKMGPRKATVTVRDNGGFGRYGVLPLIQCTFVMPDRVRPATLVHCDVPLALPAPCRNCFVDVRLCRYHLEGAI